jgi:hypothetical protein
MRRITIGLWVLAGVLVVAIAYKLLFGMTQDDTSEAPFPPLKSTDVIQAPNGHAYRYVAAPNLTWDQARKRAARLTYQGHLGYLATIDDKAEFDSVMTRVFPDNTATDVTYLGGRQTAPNEWRWVTGLMRPPMAARASCSGRAMRPAQRKAGISPTGCSAPFSMAASGTPPRCAA